MSTKSIVDCSDLYDNAAEKLKRLDNDIDKNIRDLAKNVEARGVPKNKVARQVVRELTAREVLSPSRIYEGLGIEYKREYRKRVTEETSPQVQNIVKEESLPQPVVLAASGTGQSEILEDMSGGPDNKLASEAQEKKGEPRREEVRLEEKLEKNSRLMKEMERLRGENARLRGENAKLRSDLEERVKLLTEKIEQLRKKIESAKEVRQLKLLQELQEKFHNQPGLLDAKKLQKVSIEEGKNLEIFTGKYNSIIQETLQSGRPVPVGTYIMTKPDEKLVPVRIFVEFDKRNIEISLWEKKLAS